MNHLPVEDYDDLIRRALDEDAASNDLTAQATIAPGQQGRATMSAKADGVLSGSVPAARAFELVDENIDIRWHRGDADAVVVGEVIAEFEGPLRSLLSAERTALNFLQHLSGIATATQAFVEVVAGTGCAVVDTRKTAPGLRHLEKQAVIHGGGENHRMDLESGMLIKENHIAGAGCIDAAVARCRELREQRGCTDVWIEVECETLDEVRQAVAATPEIIMLDNMTPGQTRQARALVPATIVLESSGNISLVNARAYAEAGADRIAIGAITHSAPVLDVSLRVVPQGQAA